MKDDYKDEPEQNKQDNDKANSFQSKFASLMQFLKQNQVVIVAVALAIVFLLLIWLMLGGIKGPSTSQKDIDVQIQRNPIDVNNPTIIIDTTKGDNPISAAWVVMNGDKIIFSGTTDKWGNQSISLADLLNALSDANMDYNGFTFYIVDNNTDLNRWRPNGIGNQIDLSYFFENNESKCVTGYFSDNSTGVPISGEIKLNPGSQIRLDLLSLCENSVEVELLTDLPTSARSMTIDTNSIKSITITATPISNVYGYYPLILKEKHKSGQVFSQTKDMIVLDVVILDQNSCFSLSDYEIDLEGGIEKQITYSNSCADRRSEFYPRIISSSASLEIEYSKENPGPITFDAKVHGSAVESYIVGLARSDVMDMSGSGTSASGTRKAASGMQFESEMQDFCERVSDFIEAQEADPKPASQKKTSDVPTVIVPPGSMVPNAYTSSESAGKANKIYFSSGGTNYQLPDVGDSQCFAEGSTLTTGSHSMIFNEFDCAPLSGAKAKEIQESLKDPCYWGFNFYEWKDNSSGVPSPPGYETTYNKMWKNLEANDYSADWANVKNYTLQNYEVLNAGGDIRTIKIYGGSAGLGTNWGGRNDGSFQLCDGNSQSGYASVQTDWLTVSEFMVLRNTEWSKKVTIAPVEGAVVDLGMYDAAPTAGWAGDIDGFDGTKAGDSFASGDALYNVICAKPMGLINPEAAVQRGAMDVSWLDIPLVSASNLEYDDTGKIFYNYYPWEVPAGVEIYVQNGHVYAKYVGVKKNDQKTFTLKLKGTGTDTKEYPVISIEDYVNATGNKDRMIDDRKIITTSYRLKLLGEEAPCISSTARIGVSGKGAAPKIKLDWKWSNFGMNSCSPDTNDNNIGIYCDSTQFLMSFFSRMNLIDNNYKVSVTQTVPFSTVFYANLMKDSLNTDFLLDFAKYFAESPLESKEYFTDTVSGKGLGSLITEGKLTFKVHNEGLTDMLSESEAELIADASTTTNLADKNYIVIDLNSGSGSSSYPYVLLSSPPSDLLTNDVYKTTKLVLKKMKPTNFMIGTPFDQPARNTTKGYINEKSANEQAPIDALITHDYYIGIFEVTEKQWQIVMGDYLFYRYPLDINNDANVAMSFVDWDWARGGDLNGIPDPSSFAAILSSKTGLRFDLPTNSEWQFACKGGTNTGLNDGTQITHLLEDPIDGKSMDGDAIAWTKENATDEMLRPVGMKKPNAFGLYDMQGNQREWVRDFWKYNPIGGYFVPNTVVNMLMASSQKRYNPKNREVFNGGSVMKTIGNSKCSSYSFEIWTPDSWNARAFGPGFRIAAYNTEDPYKEKPEVISTELPFAGTYRVEMRINPLEGVSRLRDVSSIEVHLYPTRKAPNYNPFLDTPFDWKVGSQNNFELLRKGYGSSSDNELNVSGELKLNNQTDSYKVLTTTTNKYEDNEKRGIVLELDSVGNITFVPTYPVPTILKTRPGPVSEILYKTSRDGFQIPIETQWDTSDGDIIDSKESSVEGKPVNSIYYPYAGEKTLRTMFFVPIKSTLNYTQMTNNAQVTVAGEKENDSIKISGTSFYGKDNIAQILSMIEEGQLCISNDYENSVQIWWNKSYTDTLK